MSSKSESTTAWSKLESSRQECGICVRGHLDKNLLVTHLPGQFYQYHGKSPMATATRDDLVTIFAHYCSRDKRRVIAPDQKAGVQGAHEAAWDTFDYLNWVADRALDFITQRFTEYTISATREQVADALFEFDEKIARTLPSQIR